MEDSISRACKVLREHHLTEVWITRQRRQSTLQSQML